jgi:uncharacterized protein
MPVDFTIGDWCWAYVAALGIGVSKSGLPGISLVHVVVMARLFPGLVSTGIVLPMLVFGDIGAVLLFRRHADLPHLFRTLPPAALGVAAGWWAMGRIHADFNRAIGWIVLALAAMQMLRDWRPGLFESAPKHRAFAWTMGFTAGVTTMVANAAGPVMGLYLLAVSLPKAVFVGTGAWFFLIINVIKLPFSAQLGLITGKSLFFNAALAPAIPLGLLLGKTVVSRLPQRLFDTLVLAFAIVAALKLIRMF